MSDRRIRLASVLAAGGLLLAATAGPSPSPAPPLGCADAATDGKNPRPHCCLTNTRYVGTCEIEPAKDETCATILEYLNNPQSQGKTYCNNTTHRGGWTLVPCEPGMKQD
jgi:hypothetical protein